MRYKPGSFVSSGAFIRASGFNPHQRFKRVYAAMRHVFGDKIFEAHENAGRGYRERGWKNAEVEIWWPCISNIICTADYGRSTK